MGEESKSWVAEEDCKCGPRQQVEKIGPRVRVGKDACRRGRDGLRGFRIPGAVWSGGLGLMIGSRGNIKMAHEYMCEQRGCVIKPKKVIGRERLSVLICKEEMRFIKNHLTGDDYFLCGKIKTPIPTMVTRIPQKNTWRKGQACVER